eukprot:TRINITY_DN2858_c0_g1_i2.p1 TRINITY_DN2858_c0_g1~~TRINITY_DN2858_c0_g1_i2.p1  ORF type:complete len:740 (-),score=130.63 TRINITY_DN2858_c0_g1_i2:100-2319(-)
MYSQTFNSDDQSRKQGVNERGGVRGKGTIKYKDPYRDDNDAANRQAREVYEKRDFYDSHAHIRNGVSANWAPSVRPPVKPIWRARAINKKPKEVPPLSTSPKTPLIIGQNQVAPTRHLAKPLLGTHTVTEQPKEVTTLESDCETALVSTQNSNVNDNFSQDTSVRCPPRPLLGTQVIDEHPKEVPILMTSPISVQNLNVNGARENLVVPTRFSANLLSKARDDEKAIREVQRGKVKPFQSINGGCENQALLARPPVRPIWGARAINKKPKEVPPLSTSPRAPLIIGQNQVAPARHLARPLLGIHTVTEQPKEVTTLESDCETALVNTQNPNVNNSSVTLPNAIMVVDCMEGLNSQSLEQALGEGVNVALLLKNWIKLFQSNFDHERVYETINRIINTANVSAVTARVTETPLFIPSKGNVIFGSAQGWGFCLHKFSKIYTQKYGYNFSEKLWGSNYFDFESKSWTNSSISSTGEKLTRGFVKYVLKPINKIYKAALQNNKPLLISFLRRLDVSLTSTELKHSGEDLFHAVMRKFSPIEAAIIGLARSNFSKPVYKLDINRLFKGHFDDTCTWLLHKHNPTTMLSYFSVYAKTADDSAVINKSNGYHVELLNSQGNLREKAPLAVVELKKGKENEIEQVELIEMVERQIKEKKEEERKETKEETEVAESEGKKEEMRRKKKRSLLLKMSLNEKILQWLRWLQLKVNIQKKRTIKRQKVLKVNIKGRKSKVIPRTTNNEKE